MRTVSCLIFHGGIPPRIVVNHGIRRRQVQPDTARLEANQKNRHFAFLKTAHHFFAILGVARQLHIAQLRLHQLRFDQFEHRGEL